jgi:hypothetical protein
MTNKFNILISTDILGMFGDIETLQRVYGYNLKNLEMISWSPTLDKQIADAKKLDYIITRLHGRLFCPKHPELGLHSLVLYGGNYLIKSTPDLIKYYASNYDILLHTPVFDDKEIISFVTSFKDSIRQLWLENHGFGELGAAKALHIVKELRNNGVNAGFCFDLAHFIGQNNLQSSNFLNDWNRLTEYLEKQLLNEKDSSGNIIPLSLHFPIGTEPGDSLPILNKIDNQMLKSFVSIIKESQISLITLENQQRGKRHYFRLEKRLVNDVSERNKKIIEKLGKAGMIP